MEECKPLVVGTPLIVQATRQAPAGYSASHPRPSNTMGRACQILTATSSNAF